MPGLFTGFLKGFNDSTTASRAEASRQADAQMERDQNILTTIAQHSEDPEIQANAIHGLISMSRGDYQPKNGLSKFLGRPAGSAPGMVSLIGALGGHKGAGSPAGAAPAGANASQPTTTLGESPTGTAAVESGAAGGATPPPAPSSSSEGDEPLPTTGLAALPGGASSSITGTQPGSRSSVAPVAGGGTAVPPVQGATVPLSAPPMAPSPAAGPGGQVKVSPPPSLSSVPGGGAWAPPTLAPGQVMYTPGQQADVNAHRQAQQQSLQRGADYKAGHDQALTSLQTSHPELSPAEMEEQAHMEGLRWAGLPYAHLQQKVIDTVDEQGNPVKETSTFDPMSGTKSIISRTPMAPQATNDFLNFVGAYLGGEFAPGTTARMMAANATPDQRQRLESAWLQLQTQQAGAKTFGTQGQQLKMVTNPDGSTTYVQGDTFQGAPPVAPKVGGGGAAPPPALSQPPAPKAAQSGGAAPPPPAPTGGLVGQRPGQPEAPVAGASPTPLPTVPAGQGIGSGRPQASPSPALDPNQVADKTWNGMPYIDTEKIGTGKQAQFTRTAAASKGVPVLDHTDAVLLRNLQAARTNVQDFAREIFPYLAQSAADRPGQTLSNWLGTFLQTNPQLVGLEARWTNAIENVKAAGASRITQSEINRGIQSMPEASDTIESAVEKIRGMTDSMNSMEHAILPLPEELVQKASAALAQHPEGAKVTLTQGPHAGEVWAIPPDGSTGYIRLK